MSPEQIALHLIKEDLKYHQVIHHLTAVEVHMEHYPDIATAVENLLVKDLSAEARQDWNDLYVQGMSKAKEIPLNNAEQIDMAYQKVLENLLRTSFPT